MAGNEWVPEAALATPAIVRSNEVTAYSPPLPTLGAMRFSFEVTPRLGIPGETIWGPGTSHCTQATRPSIDCTVFHYALGNVGDRPIRRVIGTFGPRVLPEYRDKSGVWKPVPVKSDGLGAVSAIASFQLGLLPGRSHERDFTFATDREIYDTAPLRAAGELEIRFRYNPAACFASPDASVPSWKYV